MSLIKTYVALTKPGIIRGNVIAVAAGFLLASQGVIDVVLLGATLAGMSLVIASACVFNNYIDRHIDDKMERTKARALAAGRVLPQHALIYASVLGVMGAGLLGWYVNLLALATAFVGFFFYVVLYSISKRRSVHGTLVGAVSGAVPPVAGYVAVTGSLDVAAWLLFGILAAWQMPHFYAIALFRSRDYAAAKIPVLPLVHGVRATKVQMVGYIIVFMVVSLMLTATGYTGYTYAVMMAATGAWWLRLAMRGLKVADDERWARMMFKFSLIVLLLWSVLLALEAWLP